MAVIIKYKEDFIFNNSNVGTISFSYLPLFDGKLEPYTKDDKFEVTESEPGEIQRIVKEQKELHANS